VDRGLTRVPLATVRESGPCHAIIESDVETPVSSSVRHLVGRGDELTALLELLDAPEGLPAASVIIGEAGIGKTALWLVAAEAAEARGYLVLTSRPSEAETRYSFAGLADLVGGVMPDVLPELRAPQQRALEAALALSEADGVPIDEGVVAFAFLNAVRGLAEQQRVLLAVDDVQWLDPPSLALLRFALSRLDTEPVATLLTARDRTPGWLLRSAPNGRLTTIELGPVSVGSLHELLRSRLDVALSRPALLRIWETARGNPFFALELGRALERRGGRIEPGAELPVPDALEGVLSDRLQSLTREAEGACRVVAAVSQPTAELVELAVSGSALEEALRAGVLELDGERIRFSHPLLASAVTAKAAPATRRAVHARLANLVADAEQRAHHLALAATGPAEHVAVALDAASRRARVRGAVAAAADLAEQALTLTPPVDVDAIRRRAVSAADFAFQAGDPARAAGFLNVVLRDAPSGPSRAAILQRLAAVQAQTTGPREAVPLYRAALRETGGDARLEALIHLELADTLRFATGLRSSEPHAAAAVEAAERAGDPEFLCRALSVFGLIRFTLGHGIDEEVMERAVALEDEHGVRLRRTEGGRGSLCDQRLWSNDVEAARALAEELVERGRQRDGYDDSSGLYYLALIEWRVGRWERAAELASEVTRLEEQLGREALAPSIGAPKAIIAAHRGLVDEARALARDALARARARGITTAEAIHRWVLGFLELSLGRPAAALPHLRAARELREAIGQVEPGLMRELPDLLDALVAVGELREGEAFAAAADERARALDRAWALAICARARALIRGARRDLDGAFASFDEALAQHARTSDPFQHARTLLALGTTQRRVKRRGAARATLEQALADFERLGAPLWAEQAHAELARIGGRAPSRGALTPSEQRVAALVAEGRTNREVAAVLFITERTVEAALTRVYGKLGVRSRTELAGRLRQEN
jgi:DNA-binding CsgD family transcriptional regulator